MKKAQSPSNSDICQCKALPSPPLATIWSMVGKRASSWPLALGLRSLYKPLLLSCSLPFFSPKRREVLREELQGKKRVLLVGAGLGGKLQVGGELLEFSARWRRKWDPFSLVAFGAFLSPSLFFKSIESRLGVFF